MKAGVIADGLKKSGLRPSGLSESGFRLTRFRFGPFEPNKDKYRPSWHKLSSFSPYGPKNPDSVWADQRKAEKIKDEQKHPDWIRILSGFRPYERAIFGSRTFEQIETVWTKKIRMQTEWTGESQNGSEWTEKIRIYTGWTEWILFQTVWACEFWF